MSTGESYGSSLALTDGEARGGYKNKHLASEWALFLLRVVVGCGFIAHGLAKLSGGPLAFAGILRQLGVPLPVLSAWLTIGTEIVGGAAMLIGAFLVWVSIPMGFVLLVAAFSIHFQYGFSSIRLLSISSSGARFGPVGYELDLLYLAALFTLALTGPGALAIDNILRRRTGSMLA